MLTKKKKLKLKQNIFLKLHLLRPNVANTILVFQTEIKTTITISMRKQS